MIPHRKSLIIKDRIFPRFMGSMRELVGGILTPALSRRERVNRRPPDSENRRVIIVQRRPCLLPLPEGEGRGGGSGGRLLGCQTQIRALRP